MGEGGTEPAGADPDQERPEIALDRVLGEVRALERTGDIRAARERLAATGDRYRAYAGFHLAGGALAFRAGEIERALEAFEEAIRLEPAVAELHGNLGAARLARAQRTGAPGDLAAAIAALERADALGPKLPGPLTSLAAAYLAAGRPQDAMDTLKRALRLNPRAPAIWFNLGAACHALRREADCLGALERALALRPGMVEAEAARAKTLARLGRLADAEAALAALRGRGAAPALLDDVAATLSRTGARGGGSPPGG